jgi:hypothetical protein
MRLFDDKTVIIKPIEKKYLDFEQTIKEFIEAR